MSARPCPPWCQHGSALRYEEHWRDLGIVNAWPLVLCLSLIGEQGREAVRVHVEDGRDGSTRVHDLAGDLAADLGEALTVLDLHEVRRLGEKLADGAVLLSGGQP